MPKSFLPAGKQQQQQPAGKKPLSRDAESLGWLAQSSVQPKKRRDIEGVGASSILDLKAQLYRTQEEVQFPQLSQPSNGSDSHCPTVYLPGPPSFAYRTQAGCLSLPFLLRLCMSFDQRHPCGQKVASVTHHPIPSIPFVTTGQAKG